MECSLPEPGTPSLTSRPWLPGWSLSIRVKIGLAFGMVAALAVLLLAGVLATFGVQREYQAARDDQIVLARNLASLIDAHLEDTIAALGLVAADPVLIADLEHGNHAPLNYRLEHLLTAGARPSALVVVDERATLVAISTADKSQLGRPS